MKNFIQRDGKFYCSDCNREMKVIKGFIFCEFCESSIEEILDKNARKNINNKKDS